MLQPHDYEGFGRLNAEIKSTRIATGEHEYTRYGFRQLLEHARASIWQPDIHWCGGLTEVAPDRRAGRRLRHSRDSPHRRHLRLRPFHHGDAQQPLGGAVHAAAGRAAEVYRRFEEDNQMTRGPEGIYARPSERPGLGWDIEIA